MMLSSLCGSKCKAQSLADSVSLGLGSTSWSCTHVAPHFSPRNVNTALYEILQLNVVMTAFFLLAITHRLHSYALFVLLVYIYC